MAKITLAELVAKFTGDTTGLEKSITKATALVSKYAAVAAGAAVAGTIALTRAQMKAIDANLDLAKKLSITTESLTSMKLVFDESGTSADQLSGALGIMQRNLFEAAAGSDAQRAAISALGLDIKTILELNPDQQFEALANAISQIENPTLRAGIASKIFGRNAKELALVFTDYSAKMQEVVGFNEKFNLSVSNIDSEKIAEANDAMARVFSVVKGIGNAIAVEVSPALTAMSQGILNSLPSFEKADDAVRVLIDSISVLAEFARRSFHGMQVSLGMLEVAALKTGKALNPSKWFGEQGRQMDAVIGGAERKLTDTINSFDPENTMVDKLYKARANAETKAIEQVRIASAGKGSGGDILGLFDTKATEAASKKAEDALKKIGDEYDAIIEKQQELRSDVASTFSDFTNSVMRGENALESLKKTALNVIASIVDNMFQLNFGGKSSGGIGGSIAEALMGAFGGGSLSSGSMALASSGSLLPFAEGGVVSGATRFPIGGNMGVMGEAGPEAIMPLTRGPGGKLGVQASGGGSSIVQNINVTTGVEQTVRAEIVRMMPQLREMAVSAVKNADNRGY